MIDYRDWQVLGSAFSALKLWWVLRYYGAEGLQHHLREYIRLAASVAERIAQHDQLSLIAPVSFGLLCFCHCSGNDATDELLEAINSVPQRLSRPARVSARSVSFACQSVRPRRLPRMSIDCGASLTMRYGSESDAPRSPSGDNCLQSREVCS
ncbi:MAG: pyridoxal-dependent decarboxylase [Gammaproteobacteria bacterium]|nr:pyridoxal-dependent decarboxylase [Gammaproteobacteria bacterium]